MIAVGLRDAAIETETADVIEMRLLTSHRIS